MKINISKVPLLKIEIKNLRSSTFSCLKTFLCFLIIVSTPSYELEAFAQRAVEPDLPSGDGGMDTGADLFPGGSDSGTDGGAAPDFDIDGGIDLNDFDTTDGNTNSGGGVQPSGGNTGGNGGGTQPSGGNTGSGNTTGNTSGSGSGGNSTGGTGGNNSGFGMDNMAGGFGNMLGGMGGIMGSGPDVNNFQKNDAYTRKMVQTAMQFKSLARSLANAQLKDMGVEQIPDTDIAGAGIEIAQKVIDEIMAKDVVDRYNTKVNLSAWPRTTPEDINKDYPDTFDGPCHIIYRDYFSSDKDEHYKYFQSPLFSTSRQLLDLPRVKLESMRKKYCKGASCAAGNGGQGGNSIFGGLEDLLRAKGQSSGSGVLNCLRHEKDLGKRTFAQMQKDVPNYFGADVDLSALGTDLLPMIGKKRDIDPRLCIDFVGNRFPWSGPSNKFFPAYRHLAALQQNQDAREFFQYLSSEGGEDYASASTDKLPIGHTISDHDRFFGQRGNFALEVSHDQCSNIEEMARPPLSYIQANIPEPIGDPEKSEYDGTRIALPQEADAMIEMGKAMSQQPKTSEYQAFTRYMVFKCGGGQTFRGFTLLADQSKTMCQSDRNADPYDGKVKPFWMFEIPLGKTIIPFMETRVC